jgi:hypothetical protein
MYSNGKELLEDYESYLSELSNDELDISIDSFNDFNKSIFEFSELVTGTSLGVNGTAVSAVSSPECGVSIELMRWLELSVTHNTNSDNHSHQMALFCLESKI